ncbi:TM0106 family RecB-like putative nuclease [Candidatus Synechococcus spongiarum]|uniref:TM0106 family RecB-like putative nuclease n=1 Tax=Candidatus Synechococcus spongiarum TaxID=431041 RepID=UPI0004716F47|nr:TM0106 family RecB-like putative nuclease [Candidatus Synechococcus spongiarum]
MKSDGLVISDRLLRSWLRCPRKAWQDLHDNPSRRTWHPQRAVQLGQEQRCLSRYGAGRGLVMARGTPEALRGAAAIQGLRLLAREGRFQLRGRIPLLLRRDDAKSRFGPWSYVPLLVRTGRFINREQRLCLAFLGRLLQGFQGQCPPHGLVLSGDGACQQVSLDPLQPQLDQLLEEVAVGLSQPHPPELIAERKRCAICSWRRPCNAHAAASGHLGDVSGVGAGRRRQLIRLQIHTIAELARSDPLRLGQALAREGHPNQVDHHNALAAALALQARSQQSRQAQRRPDAVPSIRNSLTTRLHQVPGVLFYDIEADPDARENYLHGFLIWTRPDPGAPLNLTLDPTGASPQHHPVLCLPHQGDGCCWRRIHGLLSRFPDWPLLHYGETERVELLRLARRAGASAASRETLQQRLMDVHQLLRQQWVLPLSSYGLKSVATWLGFRWRQPNAEGARAVLWWRHWRRHGHDHDLRRILEYNHDDCQATRVVTAWLLAQEQSL